MSEYTLFLHLAKVVEPPAKGILSRTLYDDEKRKVAIFGFAQSELAKIRRQFHECQIRADSEGNVQCH
jgi:hypothetical protein